MNRCFCYDETNEWRVLNVKLFTDLVIIRAGKAIPCVQRHEDVSDRDVHWHEDATTLVRLVGFILLRFEHFAHRKQRIMTSSVVVECLYNFHTREGLILFPVKVIHVARAYR